MSQADDLVSLICGHGLTPGRCQLKDPLACQGCAVRLKLLELAREEESKLCKTCKFWDRYGVPKNMTQFGSCYCLDVIGEHILIEHEGDYTTDFHQDFGCIHHQRKEA